jgi:hypothetical protein
MKRLDLPSLKWTLLIIASFFFTGCVAVRNATVTMNRKDSSTLSVTNGITVNTAIDLFYKTTGHIGFVLDSTNNDEISGEITYSAWNQKYHPQLSTDNFWLTIKKQQIFFIIGAPKEDISFVENTRGFLEIELGRLGIAYQTNETVRWIPPIAP